MIDAIAAPPAEAASLEAVNAFVDGGQVVFLARRPDGTLAERRERAEHVSYVDKDIPADKLRMLKSSPFALAVREEGAYYRIRWASSGDRWAVHDDLGRIGALGIPAYEADVNPVRRIISDRGVVIQAPRRAFLDIETDSRVPIARAVLGEARILSWSICDAAGQGETFVLDDDTDGAEQELLGALFETLIAYDQIVAWYGDGFDFPLINARCNWHRLRVDRRRWLWLDHLELFKKQNKTGAKSGDEKQSLKLDSIAMRLLGKGKQKFDSAKTWDAWARGYNAPSPNREDLARYNTQDTALLPQIDSATGFLGLFDVTCKVCNIFPETASLRSTRQLDGYMLRMGAQRGKHFPTRPRGEEKGDEDQYAGAYVMEPCFKGDGKTGIIRDVHVADFASLYPSMIVTFNMSPDTKVAVPVNGPIPEGACRAPTTGQGFRTDRVGLLAEAVTEVLSHRAAWKKKIKAAVIAGDAEGEVAAKRLSDAYKVIANSFYGVMGSRFSRFYDVHIAESITLTGKWLIEAVLHEARLRGMDPGYADTDSAFIAGCTRTAFEDLVKHCNKDVFPAILKAQGCTVNTVNLAYEKQFDRVVFMKKKRYIGTYVHKDGDTVKPEADGGMPAEVKGLEYKRGDAIRFARVLQTKIIDLFRKGIDEPGPYAELVAFAREALRHMPLLIEDVQITKSVKPLNEYKAAKLKKDGTMSAQPAHVEIAKQLIKRGMGTGEGGRVSYVIIDGDASPKVTLPACDFKGACDRRHLWNELTYKPTKRVLEKMFPARNWDVYDIAKPRSGKKGGGAFTLELFTPPADAVERGMEILGAPKPGEEQDDFDDEMEDDEEVAAQ